MKHLTAIKVPNGVIGWSDSCWINRVIHPDSWKKKLLRISARSLGIVCPIQVNNRVSLGGKPLRIEAVFERFQVKISSRMVNAIYVNGNRNPPRIYIWGRYDSGKYFFLKVGNASDNQSFKNELAVTSHLSARSNILFFRVSEVVETKRFIAAVSEGFPPQKMDQLARLDQRSVFNWLTECNTPGEGPFGGCIHGDLASNNVFSDGEKVWILDWEFGAVKGPEYGDLIAVASEIVIRNETRNDWFISIQELIAEKIHIRLSLDDIAETLKFVARHGNSRIKNYLDDFGAY